MKQITLAAVMALALTAPASAGDVEKILGGIIVGGLIVDALNDGPRRVENHYYYDDPRPRVHVQQPDPNWICYQDVEYSGQWIYTYDRNCWGDVIRFTRHPNPNW